VFRYRGVLLPLSLLPALIWPSEAHGWVHLGVGTALVMAGLALRLAGVREIGSRARVHRAGARTLHTGGVFAHLRNPLYLGNLLVLLGGVALLRSLWSLPLVAAAGLALYSAVDAHEEGELAQQLGEPYRRYRSEVARWLPSWPARARTRARRSTPPTAWHEVIRIERRFIAICAAALATGWLLQLHPARPLAQLLPLPTDVRLAAAALLVLTSAALWLHVEGRRRRRQRLRTRV